MNNNQFALPGKYLTFALAGEIYGLPIEQVREIIRMCEITYVPRMPDYVAGILNLRGKILPIVNLRLRFGLQAIDRTKDTCIIVVDTKDGSIGIIVDSVNEVQELSQSQIGETTMVSHALKKHYVIGLGKTEKQVLILISLADGMGLKNLEDPQIESKDAA